MRTSKGHIFLIGFMGVGKTTVSMGLRELLSMDICEMDQEIERREGIRISEIFERHGEAYFRSLETGLLKELTEKEGMIVSCGGGTPLRPCNVELMKSCGKIVFLTARPETVLARVLDNHDRPLLEHNKNVEFIAGLMEERREKYEAAADMIVSTDGKSAEEICREIIAGI